MSQKQHKLAIWISIAWADFIILVTGIVPAGKYTISGDLGDFRGLVSKDQTRFLLETGKTRKKMSLEPRINVHGHGCCRASSEAYAHHCNQHWWQSTNLLSSNSSYSLAGSCAAKNKNKEEEKPTCFTALELPPFSSLVKKRLGCAAELPE